EHVCDHGPQGAVLPAGGRDEPVALPELRPKRDSHFYRREDDCELPVRLASRALAIAAGDCVAAGGFDRGVAHRGAAGEGGKCWRYGQDGCHALTLGQRPGLAPWWVSRSTTHPTAYGPV